MTKIIHIGSVDPEQGHGGVEQFARDLRAAVGKISFLAYHVKGDPPWETAQRLNKLHISSGEIGPDDIVIADGFYGLGLAGKVKRLIIVCHGSYAGMLREYNINPPPNYDKLHGYLVQAASFQEKAYRSGEVVAVSESAAYDLYDIYGLENVEIIRNGIDINLYQSTQAEDGMVEVAGNDTRKGSDIIQKLNAVGEGINRLGFEGEKHERWQRFRYALLPSRYEGGQYAALEALASGLTIIAYRSGFFDIDVPTEYFYGTYDYHPNSFLELIDQAEDEWLSGRQWVEKEASIDKFNAEWKEFLDV